jgi:hypothetical protein
LHSYGQKISQGLTRKSFGLGAVAVAAALSGPATAHAAQTVMVGNQPVTVPSSGIVTVNGQPVPVLPGAHRIVTIAPPTGSTAVQEGGQTSYQLPAGATGESFSVPSLSDPANSGTTSIPSTAVYSTTSPALRAFAKPDTAIAWGCVISASAPQKLGGSYTVKGYALADDCTDPVQLQVTATLWWENGVNTGWQDQGDNVNSGTSSVTASASHSCTKNTYHGWHLENQTIGYYNGVEAAGTVNSDNAFISCV